MMPTLHTDRLTLRPYRRTDFDAYAALMSSDRAVHMGGPADSQKAWTWFTNDVAAFALNGFGCFAIEQGGALAGFVGLIHPPHFPEPECGWGLYDGFTGRGIVTEAARTVLDHTFATTDLTSVVSYIAPANTASVHVAARLDAKRDMSATPPAGWYSHVYRHFPQRTAA